jgi:hypothetical protein
MSGQLHAPTALLRGMSPRYPLYKRLGGPQSRSEQRGEEKILVPTGTKLRHLCRPVLHPGFTIIPYISIYIDHTEKGLK